jgi:DNA-binding NtrC family response regulator
MTGSSTRNGKRKTENGKLKQAMPLDLRSSSGLPGHRRGDDPALPGMIGCSAVLQEIVQTTRRVAPSRACVLIVGETGTGKELIARAIHDLSPRSTGPYIRVNCGALTESLLESELFGHVKGSFTGAVDNRTGRFEAAHAGSIFLDEINSTSPKLQVKLLRVLQEGEFERVGDNNTKKVDTRIIAATNRDLLEEIEAGRFREDLYYRLNVVPVYLPPLRERREDIEPLVLHFLARYADQNRREMRRVHPEAMRLLREHDWPGNVRELQNYVERAVILGTSPELTVEHLPPQLRGQSVPRPIRPRAGGTDLAALCTELVRQGLRAAGPAANDLYDRVVGRVERELIQQVMQTCDRIQIKAAARLGINRNTLHKKLSEFRLDDATTATAGSPPVPENGDGYGRDDDEDERLETPNQPRPGAGASVPAPPVEED